MIDKGGRIYPVIDEIPLDLESDCVFHIRGTANASPVDVEFLPYPVNEVSQSMMMYFVLDNDCSNLSVNNILSTINGLSTKTLRKQLNLISLMIEATQYDEEDRSVWPFEGDFKLPTDKTLKSIEYNLVYRSKCLTADECGNEVNRLYATVKDQDGNILGTVNVGETLVVTAGEGQCIEFSGIRDNKPYASINITDPT